VGIDPDVRLGHQLPSDTLLLMNVPADHGEPEITRTSSVVAYQNTWMTVREDRVRRRDGTLGLFGVVDKPDFALILPFADGGFHLVEQFRYALGRRCWEFPQGSWEQNPTADPRDLARGELKEETGLLAAEVEAIGYLHNSPGFCSQGFHVFLATGLTEGDQQLEDSEAGLIHRWFPYEDVWGLIRDGRLTDAASVAALGLFDRLHRGGA
jgi:8-oxo-dGTP pyrophosphatase MutT (NUDIX family)